MATMRELRTSNMNRMRNLWKAAGQWRQVAMRPESELPVIRFNAAYDMALQCSELIQEATRKKIEGQGHHRAGLEYLVQTLKLIGVSCCRRLRPSIRA